MPCKTVVKLSEQKNEVGCSYMTWNCKRKTVMEEEHPKSQMVRYLYAAEMILCSRGNLKALHTHFAFKDCPWLSLQRFVWWWMRKILVETVKQAIKCSVSSPWSGCNNPKQLQSACGCELMLLLHKTSVWKWFSSSRWHWIHSRSSCFLQSDRLQILNVTWWNVWKYICDAALNWPYRCDFMLRFIRWKLVPQSSKSCCFFLPIFTFTAN